MTKGIWQFDIEMISFSYPNFTGGRYARESRQDHARHVDVGC
jgi:hypothetical protein